MKKFEKIPILSVRPFVTTLIPIIPFFLAFFLRHVTLLSRESKFPTGNYLFQLKCQFFAPVISTGAEGAIVLLSHYH